MPEENRESKSETELLVKLHVTAAPTYFSENDRNLLYNIHRLLHSINDQLSELKTMEQDVLDLQAQLDAKLSAISVAEQAQAAALTSAQASLATASAQVADLQTKLAGEHSDAIGVLTEALNSATATLGNFPSAAPAPAPAADGQ
jgi:peptidoglycan hydrolase CwlO-like protein